MEEQISAVSDSDLEEAAHGFENIPSDPELGTPERFYLGQVRVENRPFLLGLIVCKGFTVHPYYRLLSKVNEAGDLDWVPCPQLSIWGHKSGARVESGQVMLTSGGRDHRLVPRLDREGEFSLRDMGPN